MTIRVRRLLVVALWMALIAAASSIPSPEGSPGLGRWDKLAHVAAYGTLGFLLARAIFLDGIKYKWQIAVVTAAATLYGMSDELHQSFIPGREMSAGDLTADAAGALFAACALYWLRTRRAMLAQRGIE